MNDIYASEVVYLVLILAIFGSFFRTIISACDNRLFGSFPRRQWRSSSSALALLDLRRTEWRFVKGVYLDDSLVPHLAVYIKTK